METLPQEPELLVTSRDVQSVNPSVSSVNIQRSLVHVLTSKQGDLKVRLSPTIICMGEHGFSSGDSQVPKLHLSPCTLV